MHVLHRKKVSNKRSSLTGMGIDLSGEKSSSYCCNTFMLFNLRPPLSLYEDLRGRYIFRMCRSVWLSSETRNISIPALSKQLGAIKNNDVSKATNSGFSLKAEYILLVL